MARRALSERGERGEREEREKKVRTRMVETFAALTENVEAKVVHQHAAHDVERDVIAGVADMRGVIHRRPTHVPLDEAWVDGNERLHLLGERIKQREAARRRVAVADDQRCTSANRRCCCLHTNRRRPSESATSGRHKASAIVDDERRSRAARTRQRERQKVQTALNARLHILGNPVRSQDEVATSPVDLRRRGQASQTTWLPTQTFQKTICTVPNSDTYNRTLSPQGRGGGASRLTPHRRPLHATGLVSSTTCSCSRCCASSTCSAASSSHAA